jgi:putative metal-binding protein/hemolysin type calcium-binding protein
MRRQGRRSCWVMCATLVVVVGLAAPSGAYADGAVTLVGGELRFSSNSQDAENLVITRATSPASECNPRPTPCLQLANGPQEITDQVPGDACEQLIFNGQPFETIVVCATNVAPTIRLTLNDGDDFVSMGPSVPPTTMDGGSGDDNLSSDSGADTVLGGTGNDSISDDGGVDLLDGGADNDSIALGPGNDNVIGGTGADTVRLESGDDTVRLDDIANDGPPGVAKNIHSDVEVVDGGGGSDNLFGNAAANTLLGGSGNDLIDGGAGPDVLEGGIGADELNGGPDVDRVVYSGSGAQTITLDDVRDDGVAGELDNTHSDIEDVAAGPGNDSVVGSDVANVLEGGDGDDRLEGRGAVDGFFGGAGADALFARDGLQERVECGPDADAGESDTIDLLVDCEGVQLSSALVPDVDGDGVSKPTDCNDENPAIRPGAPDTPQNGIDEDCSGADATFPVPPQKRITSKVRATWGVSGKRIFLLRLTVSGVPKGGKVELRCSKSKGGKCPFKRSGSKKRRRGTITLFNEVSASKVQRMKLRRFRAGQQLELRITAKGFIGKVVRYKLKKGKIPSGQTLCLPVGQKKPRARC